MKGIYPSLKLAGIYLMQDIKRLERDAQKYRTPARNPSCMHRMTVSLAQGGEGLGAMWGEEKTREYLARAGFPSVEKRELAHDLQNNWYVVRK